MTMTVHPVHPVAWQAAQEWPLAITTDEGERLAGDGTRRTGQQLHIRCGRSYCGQSVFCAANDSGPYRWNLRGQLMPALLAHLFQCHRDDMGLADEAELAAGPAEHPDR